MDTVALVSIFGTGVTILLTIIGTGITLGVLMQRTARRLDDRITADKVAADADRRAADARFDAAIKAFRDEMRDLATRQAHLDGRLDGREAAAD